MSEALELHVLGCGDAMGSGGRFQTCFSLRRGGERVLVDFGVTGMLAMQRAGIDSNEVGLVLLTHLHGDHFGGLPYLLLNAKYVARRREPLVIAGPPSGRERFETVMEALYPGSTSTPLGFDLSWEELGVGRTFAFRDLRVTPFGMVHGSGAPSHGLRIEWGGKTFSYSGDSEWTDELIPLAHDADIFICEASFYDRRVPNHLDYATILEKRARLGAKRILLTHLSDEMLARRHDLEIECLEDGLVVDF